MEPILAPLLKTTSVDLRFMPNNLQFTTVKLKLIQDGAHWMLYLFTTVLNEHHMK